MIGRTAYDPRRAFLVEWNCLEIYPRKDKYITQPGARVRS